MRGWEHDLRKIAELNPPHVSTYALMIEDGTKLANQGVKEGHEGITISMWRLAEEYLSNAIGLHRYEVSNFAKRGFECRHNYKVWMGGSFIGAGPSASYFVGGSRWTNPISLTNWLNGEHPQEDYINPKKRSIEVLITGLRTTKGWVRDHFKEVTGFDFFEMRGPTLKEFIQSGHMSYTDKTLRLTNKGLLLADFIGSELL